MPPQHSSNAQSSCHVLLPAAFLSSLMVQYLFPVLTDPLSLIIDGPVSFSCFGRPTFSHHSFIDGPVSFSCFGRPTVSHH